MKGVTYEEFTEWRSVDGLLCRGNKDCNWLDENLVCAQKPLYEDEGTIIYRNYAKINTTVSITVKLNSDDNSLRT